MTDKMTPALRLALRDCAAFSLYYWKPQAMEKLARLGFVERVPVEPKCYRITSAGRKALADG